MPWVRFIHDFDFRPPEKPKRICIAYKKGMVQFVRRCCAEKAIENGKALLVERPSKCSAE